MDASANIIDAKFFRSAIRSVASLTYDEAQAMLDTPDESIGDPASLSARIITSVKSLNILARLLRSIFPLIFFTVELDKSELTKELSLLPRPRFALNLRAILIILLM